VKFFKKTNKSRVFVLQDDGRHGAVHEQGAAFQNDCLDMFSPSTGKTRYMRTTISRTRLRIFSIVLASFVLLFLSKAAHLQIIQGDHYFGLAQNNREYTSLLVPARGTIFDRWGRELATNEPTFTMTMRIADLPEDNDARTDQIAHVASIAGLQPTDIDLSISKYSNYSYDYVPVKEHVNYETAMRLAIELSGIPAFDLTNNTKRVYSSSAPSLAHVMGYTGLVSANDLDTLDDSYRAIDEIGKLGVEREGESLLRGLPGSVVYEVDARGNQQTIVSKTDPVAGADISLGIDLEFQKYIENALQNTLDRVGATRGSVVAIDPLTGAVRALVSLPTYDSNLFIGGIGSEQYSNLLEDEDNPLFPRAIAGEFPSGSTFKPFIAYAAMVEGIVSEHTSFLSTGGIGISQWYFPDWKAGGHGITDVRKAISESVNTYFYIVGGGFDSVVGLGVSRINKNAKLFGFGTPTGIDIPGENDGFLPTKEWKKEAKGERWYVGDTYHLAIGQGDFLTTPLQMAVATSVIANGGNLFEPYVIESVDGYGNVDFSKGKMTPIEGLDTYAMEVVRQSMRQTITTGSARSLSSLTEAVAGKTGTAQAPGDRPYHSWFTGFGPYNEPNLTLTVLVEEGGESNEAAVPLARQIYDWWFRYGQGV
jgi:penicillin-binding protein 2